MPSIKRRMNLTIPDELGHAFDEFREATGIAPASFVVQMLVESIPMLESVTKAARMAKQGNIEALDLINTTLSSALHQGMGIQHDMLEQTSQLRKARSDAPKKRNRVSSKQGSPE